MKPAATVLIPTHDHGPTVLRTVKSALSQTVGELEILVVGDGVPEGDKPAIIELTRTERRVRFLDNPKGPRHGETHRHRALQEARGEIVCYLSDDDLWLPDHVATMQRLLRQASFAGARAITVDVEGRISTHVGDFSVPFWMEVMRSGTGNFLGLSFVAHTLALYRSLPYGWRAAPENIWTDLYMWQQFLAHPECRPISAPLPTLLNFPAGPRKAWTRENRARELDGWLTLIGEPQGRAELEREFTAMMLLRAAEKEARLSVVERTLAFLSTTTDAARAHRREPPATLAATRDLALGRLRQTVAHIPGGLSAVRLLKRTVRRVLPDRR